MANASRSWLVIASSKRATAARVSSAVVMAVAPLPQPTGAGRPPAPLDAVQRGPPPGIPGRSDPGGTRLSPRTLRRRHHRPPPERDGGGGERAAVAADRDRTP